MKNLTNMMKQAQEMQSKMAEMQDRLGDIEVTGQAGGGMVSIVTTAKHEVRSLSIDPSLINPEEAEMLEDLVVAAINDARAKAEARVQEETSQLMGGLKLPPGVKLPF